MAFQSAASDLTDDRPSRQVGVFTARLIPVIEDSDGDQLPDVWERHYFKSLVESDSVDSDGDGFSNRHEWLIGTDPADTFSVPALDVPVSVATGSKLSWLGGASGSSRLQFKDSLSDTEWVDVPGITVITSDQSTLIDTNAPATGTRFYRLRAAPQP
jgi:hypothetical protein